MCPRNELSLPNLKTFLATSFNDSILFCCTAYVLLCVCEFMYIYICRRKMCEERKEKGFHMPGFGRCVSTFDLLSFSYIS